MNRPLLIAAFGLLLASLPLSAQHGGMHGSAGGHGGMSSRGGFSSHSSGHGFGGSHGGAVFGSGPVSHRFSGGPIASARLGSRNFNNHFGNRFGRGPFRNGFRNNCFGFRCRGRFGLGFGFGWPWYGDSFDPSWWGDSGSSYDDDRDREIGIANDMNAQSLDEQRMRAQSDQDIYAPAAPARPRPEQTSEALPPTVLLFRDQRKKEVQNYAIVGQTLWIFSQQHTEKIPLSDLDLPATEKANNDRGVDFRVPVPVEGQ